MVGPGRRATGFRASRTGQPAVREWAAIGEIEAQEAEVTLSIEGHIMPWTEDDYLSLGETPERIELLVIDADAVRLVCEITSPSNAGHDRVMKTHYYAAAGIPWYLLVDPDEPTLHLFRLDAAAYREHAVAAPGTLLAMTEPVRAAIDPATLVK